MIREALELAGYEVDVWYSDLYVKLVPGVEMLLAGVHPRPHYTRFVSPKDGAVWLELPFQNESYFQRALAEPRLPGQTG